MVFSWCIETPYIPRDDNHFITWDVRRDTYLSKLMACLSLLEVLLLLLFFFCRLVASFLSLEIIFFRVLREFLIPNLSLGWGLRVPYPI
jgi:hypothetical protein